MIEHSLDIPELLAYYDGSMPPEAGLQLHCLLSLLLQLQGRAERALKCDDTTAKAEADTMKQSEQGAAVTTNHESIAITDRAVSFRHLHAATEPCARYHRCSNFV